jgi:hypothetical protein
MKQTPGNGSTVTAEEHVREIRRQTRKKYSSEEKIRIVLSGLRGEHSIAELVRNRPATTNSDTDYPRITAVKIWASKARKVTPAVRARVRSSAATSRSTWVSRRTRPRSLSAARCVATATRTAFSRFRRALRQVKFIMPDYR